MGAYIYRHFRPFDVQHLEHEESIRLTAVQLYCVLQY
jgi:hypothetical protein